MQHRHSDTRRLWHPSAYSLRALRMAVGHLRNGNSPKDDGRLGDCSTDGSRNLASGVRDSEDLKGAFLGDLPVRPQRSSSTLVRSILDWLCFPVYFIRPCGSRVCRHPDLFGDRYWCDHRRMCCWPALFPVHRIHRHRFSQAACHRPASWSDKAISMPSVRTARDSRVNPRPRYGITLERPD